MQRLGVRVGERGGGYLGVFFVRHCLKGAQGTLARVLASFSHSDLAWIAGCSTSDDSSRSIATPAV